MKKDTSRDSLISLLLPLGLILLAAIVMLRTLLNYFLEREIQQGKERRSPELPREQEIVSNTR